MNPKIRLLFGSVLLLWLGLISPSEANTQTTPLLALLQELHCASTEQQAAAALTKLSGLPLTPFGIPNESLTTGRNAELYAATVDIMLKVLHETIQRFPQLQEKAERTALSWNYCDIVNEGDLADLFTAGNGQIVKKEAVVPFPLRKQGFEVWGFIRGKSRKSYVPALLDYPSLFPNAYQDLLHRLTQHQCFPNPDLTSDADVRPYHGLLHLSEALEPGQPYPYSWNGQCSPQPLAKKPPKPPGPPAKTQLLPRDVNSVAQVNPSAILLPELSDKPAQAPVKTAPKSKAQSHRPSTKNTGKNPQRTLIAGLIAEHYVQPTETENPSLSPAIPSGNSNIGAPLPLPPANGLGLAGNFYHRAKLTGALSFGANASWKPYSYFFLRGGVNYSYFPGSGDFSYSWGLGYDDWHRGTFSAQINNWGPITPGKNSIFSGASANLGYKFVADFLKPYHLSGSAAVNIPFSGDPSISTTWVWSPIDHWFIRTSLSKSLTQAGGLDWSYSFGYSDWRPFTFSLTYDNWGTNPIFDSSQSNNFNFTENGAVSLSWSWAF